MPELHGLNYSVKNVRTPIAALVTLLVIVGAGTGYLIHKNTIAQRWETNTNDSFKSVGSNLELSAPLTSANRAFDVTAWSKHDIVIWEANHLWDDSRYPAMVNAVKSLREYNPDEILLGRVPIMSIFASDRDSSAGWSKARWDALSPYIALTSAGDTSSSVSGRYDLNILSTACRDAIVNLLVQYINASSNGISDAHGGVGVLWTDVNVPPDESTIDLDSDTVAQSSDADEQQALKDAYADIINKTRAALPNLIQIGEGRYAFVGMRPLLDGANLKYFPADYFGTSPSRTEKEFAAAFSPIDSTSIQVRKESFKKNLGGPYVIIDNRDLKYAANDNAILNYSPALLAAATIIEGVFATIPTNDLSGNLFKDGYYYPPREFELGRIKDPIIMTRYTSNLSPVMYRVFENGTLTLTVVDNENLRFNWVKSGSSQEPNIHSPIAEAAIPNLVEGSFALSDSCQDRTSEGFYDPPSYQGFQYSFEADQSVDHFVQFKQSPTDEWKPELDISDANSWIFNNSTYFTDFFNLTNPRLAMFTAPYPDGCEGAAGDSIYVRVKFRNSNSWLESGWFPTEDGRFLKFENEYSFVDTLPPVFVSYDVTCENFGQEQLAVVSASDANPQGSSFRFKFDTMPEATNSRVNPELVSNPWSDWSDVADGYSSYAEKRYFETLSTAEKFVIYIQAKDPSGNTSSTLRDSFTTGIDIENLCTELPPGSAPNLSTWSSSVYRSPTTGDRASTDITVLNVIATFDAPCYMVVQEAIPSGTVPNTTYYPAITGLTDLAYTATSRAWTGSPTITMIRNTAALSDSHNVTLIRTNDVNSTADGNVYRAKITFKDAAGNNSEFGLPTVTLPDISPPRVTATASFVCADADSPAVAVTFAPRIATTVMPYEHYYAFIQVKASTESADLWWPSYSGIDDANWSDSSEGFVSYALIDTARLKTDYTCAAPPPTIDVRYRVKDATGNTMDWTTGLQVQTGFAAGALTATADIPDIGSEPTISITQDISTPVYTLAMWKFSSCASWMAPTVNTDWDTVRNAVETKYASTDYWTAGTSLTFVPDVTNNGVNDDFDWSGGSGAVTSLVDLTATYNSNISSTSYGLYTNPVAGIEKLRCFQGDTLFVRTKVRDVATQVVSADWTVDTVVVNIPLKVRGSITTDSGTFSAISSPFTWTNDGYLTAAAMWTGITKNYFDRTPGVGGWTRANIPSSLYLSRFIDWRKAAKNDISSPAYAYFSTPGTWTYYEYPNFRNYVDQTRTINTDHIVLFHFNLNWTQARSAATYLANNQIYCPGNVSLELFKLTGNNLAMTRNYYRAGLGNVPADTSHYPEQKVSYIDQDRFSSGAVSMFSAPGDTAFQNFSTAENFWNLVGADPFDGHVAGGYGDDYYYNPAKGAAFRDSLAQKIITLLSHSYNWRLGVGIFFDYVNTQGGIQDWSDNNLFPDFDGNGVSTYWDRIEQHRLAYAYSDFMDKLRYYATQAGNPDFIIVANGQGSIRPDQVMPAYTAAETTVTLRASDTTFPNFDSFNTFGTNGSMWESPPFLHTIASEDTGLTTSGRNAYTDLHANAVNTFRDYLDSRRTHFNFAKNYIQKNSMFVKYFSGEPDTLKLFVRTNIAGLPTLNFFNYEDEAALTEYKWYDTNLDGLFTDNEIPIDGTKGHAYGDIFAKLYDTPQAPVFLILQNELDQGMWIDPTYGLTNDTRSSAIRMLGLSMSDWPFNDSVRMPEFMGGKDLNLGTPIGDIVTRQAVSPSVEDTIYKQFTNGYIKLVWKNSYGLSSADGANITNSAAVGGPYTTKYYRDGFPTKGYADADSSMPFEFIAVNTATTPDTLRLSRRWPRQEPAPTISAQSTVFLGATATHYPKIIVNATASKASRMFVQIRKSGTSTWEPTYTNTHDANWISATTAMKDTVTATLNTAIAGDSWNVRVRYQTGNIDEGYLSDWVSLSDVAIYSNGVGGYSLLASVLSSSKFSATVDSILVAYISTPGVSALSQYKIGYNGTWLPPVASDVYSDTRWKALSTSFTDTISTYGSVAAAYDDTIYYRARLMSTGYIASDWVYTLYPSGSTAKWPVVFAPSLVTGTFTSALDCYNSRYRVTASATSNVPAKLSVHLSSTRPTPGAVVMDITSAYALTSSGSATNSTSTMSCPPLVQETVTTEFYLTERTGLYTKIATIQDIVDPVAVPAPVISSITAGCVTTGTSLTITGTNFGSTQGTGKIELCNNLSYSSSTITTDQTISSWSDNSVTFTVDASEYSLDTGGYLFITTGAGSISSQGLYAKIGPAVIISGPASVLDGQLISVTGSSFGTIQNANTSLIAGNASTWAACTITSAATIVSWGNNSISATFNQGSLSGTGSVYLYVVNTQGCRSSAYTTVFTQLVTREITSITASNDTLTINGAGFGLGPTVLVCDKFENVTAGQDLATTPYLGSGTWTRLASGGASPFYSQYSATTSHSGSQSLSTIPYSATDSRGNMRVVLPAGQKYYVDFWNRYSLGTSAETNKLTVVPRALSIWGSYGTAPFLYSSAVYGSGRTLGAPTYKNERSLPPVQPTVYSSGNVVETHDSWNHYRAFYTQATATEATDGAYKAFVNNSVISEQTGISTFIGATKWTEFIPFFGLQTFTDSTSVRSYLDDLYVSLGWSRVEATSVDKLTRNILYPVSWSDTQIKAILEPGTWPSKLPIDIQVFDDVDSTGYYRTEVTGSYPVLTNLSAVDTCISSYHAIKLSATISDSGSVFTQYSLDNGLTWTPPDEGISDERNWSDPLSAEAEYSTIIPTSILCSEYGWFYWRMRTRDASSTLISNATENQQLNYLDLSAPVVSSASVNFDCSSESTFGGVRFGLTVATDELSYARIVATDTTASPDVPDTSAWSVDIKTLGTFYFDSDTLCTSGHVFYIDYQLKDVQGNETEWARLDTLETTAGATVTGINISSDNSTVTISGSGFGSGSTVLFFDTFTGETPGAVINATRPELPTLAQGGIAYTQFAAFQNSYYAQSPTNSANIVAKRTPIDGSEISIPNGGLFSRFIDYSGASRVFASAKVKYDLKKSPAVSDTSGSQVVLLLGNNTSPTRYTHVRFVDIDTCLNLAINSDGTTTRYRPTENQEKASWDSLSGVWRKIDVDYVPNTWSGTTTSRTYNYDGSAKVWVDATKVIDISDKRFITSPVSSVDLLTNNPYPSYVGFMRRINPNLKGGVGDSVYVDDLVALSNPARVEIGNASTLAACTVRNICMHTSWSDEQIIISLNMTGLTVQQATWLYIFDQDGNYVIRQLRGGALGESSRRTATFQYDGSANLPTGWTATSQTWTNARYNLVGEQGMFVTQSNWLWDPFYSGNANLGDSLHVPTRNPNIRILGRVEPQDIYESYGSASYDDSLFYSALWDSMAPFYMHTTAADTCWRDASGDRRLVINLSKVGAPTAFAGLIYDFFIKDNNTNKGSGYGVFLDNWFSKVYSTFISSVATMDVDEDATGYNADTDDQALWKSGMRAVVDTLRAKMASAGYNDFLVIGNGSAWAKADNDTTLLNNLDGVLLENYPDYLAGTSTCPSDKDFEYAFGSAVSLYNKPDDVRSLLNTSRGGPYVMLMNTSYSTDNLEALAFMSRSSSTAYDWVVYTKLGSVQMESPRTNHPTYPFITDYINQPATQSSVDESAVAAGGRLVAVRYFDGYNAEIDLSLQAAAFSQTITTLCSPTVPVTIYGANNPLPFYSYTITDAQLNVIRSYSVPLGTIHATYDWTAPTTGSAVSYYKVQHSTDGGINWVEYQTADATTAYTIHAVRTLQNTIRVAAVDATGRQGPWSTQSAIYVPTLNEADPGDPLQ